MQTEQQDEIAKGHNPDSLSNAQVGIVEGWRLLAHVTHGLPVYDEGVQIWDPPRGWYKAFTYLDHRTYRARGLPAEPAPESEQTLPWEIQLKCPKCGRVGVVSPMEGQEAFCSCGFSALVPNLESAMPAWESEVQPEDSGGNKCIGRIPEDEQYPTMLEEEIKADFQVWKEKKGSGGKTPEQMRVEIAAWLGYTNIDIPWGWVPPEAIGDLPYMVQIPDYPASLDAMATAEATLTDEEYADYIQELFARSDRFSCASALVRAGAFLAVKGAPK